MTGRRRAVRSALPVLLLVPIALVVALLLHSGRPAEPRHQAAYTGPGTADLVAVGTGPNYWSTQLNAIDVFFTDGRRQVVTPTTLGFAPVPGGPGQYFSSFATGDLNRDGRTDLVIGMPGGECCAGRVLVAYNDTEGFTDADTTELPDAPIRAQRPDDPSTEFGQAVAISGRAVGPDHDLWVGAPESSPGGVRGAGAVYRYSIGPDGTATLLDTITQDSLLVPGHSVRGDRFGQVLDPTTNGVVVGMPYKNVSGLQNAGAVVVLRTDRTSQKLIAGQELDQDSPGVPGHAEKRDHFGTSVAGGGAIVGVPDEGTFFGGPPVVGMLDADLNPRYPDAEGHRTGTMAHAGLVQLFSPSTRDPGLLVPGPAYTEDSAEIPGKVRSADHFGLSVAAGQFTCPGVTTFAISAFTAFAFGVKSAGTVTLLPDPAAHSSCPTTVLSKGHGLPGIAGGPKKSEATGEALGVARGNRADAANRVDRLLIGIPHENLHYGDTSEWGGRIIVYRGSAAASIWLSPLPDNPVKDVFGYRFANQAGVFPQLGLT